MWILLMDTYAEFDSSPFLIHSLCSRNVIHLRWHHRHTQAYPYHVRLNFMQTTTHKWIYFNQSHWNCSIGIHEVVTEFICHSWLSKLFSSIVLDCQRHRSERHTRAHTQTHPKQIWDQRTIKLDLFSPKLVYINRLMDSIHNQSNSIRSNRIESKPRMPEIERENEKCSRLSEI